MSIERTWPEDPERVESRLRGLVASVVRPEELVSLRLDWVTHAWQRPERPEVRRLVLRFTLRAVEGETFQQEIWDPRRPSDWESRLYELADQLEDWVGETSFAWGQLRIAEVPG